MQSLDGSTRDTAHGFVRTHLPTLHQLVRTGQNGHFFKLIEKTFHLLNDLQFCCLPLNLRGLCVSHYVAAQTNEKHEEMAKLYDTWLDKESEAIEQEFGFIDDLPEEQVALISFVRQSIFTTLYEEQDKLKAQDPYHPFLSVCDANGEKNTEYYKYIEKREKATAELKKPLNQKKIRRFEGFQAQNLTNNGVQTAKLSTNEAELIDKTVAAVTQTFLNLSLEEPTKMDKDYFLFDLIQSKVALLQDEKALTNLEYSRRQTEEYIAKDIANDIWKAYSNKENKTFEQVYGFSLERMDPKLRSFRMTLRKIFYKLIYNEQPGEGFPFVSICNRNGVLNESYWIDMLNAQARRNNEKPSEDYCDLEKLPDCEIIRINSAPAQAKEDGITDSTNLRQTGAITPKFCRDVLASMKQFSTETKEYFTQSDTITGQNDPLKTIFLSTSLSLYEKIRLLQDEFSDTLAFTNYARGYSKGLLEKLNITYNPSASGLLVRINPTEQRKSQNLGKSREFTLLRKSGPIEPVEPKYPAASKPIAIRNPSSTDPETLLLRKSQNRETSIDFLRESSPTPYLEQAPFEDSSLEEDCSDFQKELAHIRKYKKRTPNSPIDSQHQELIECINVYACALKSLGQQLNKFGLLVHHFATGLKQQEDGRLQKIAAQALKNDDFGSSPRRRGSSIRKRAASPPSSTNRAIRPDFASPRASTGAILIPQLSISPPHRPLAKSPNDELHPPADVSPRIENMNPAKFVETANLCLLVQRVFMDVSQLLSSEICLTSSPQNSKPATEEEEYLL